MNDFPQIPIKFYCEEWFIERFFLERYSLIIFTGREENWIPWILKSEYELEERKFSTLPVVTNHWRDDGELGFGETGAYIWNNGQSNGCNLNSLGIWRNEHFEGTLSSVNIHICHNWRYPWNASDNHILGKINKKWKKTLRYDWCDISLVVMIKTKISYSKKVMMCNKKKLATKIISYI